MQLRQSVFSIFDSKAEAYNLPFFSPSKPAAIRSFIDAINDESTTLSKHPEDYFLYYIGEFDALTGYLEAQPLVSLGSGLEFKRSP